MKIGIPRSLYYYYFKDLWINFFEFLNIKVIVSPETNKEIFDLGIKNSQDEMCLSMKNYIGHVLYLKDKCDYILIPRIDNYGRDNQTCTNFLSTYDIVNNLFDVNILNYNINYLNHEDELKGFLSIGKVLNIDNKDVINAYIYAKKEEKKIKSHNILKNQEKLNSNKIKILIVGHPYNVHDKFIGYPIIKMLKSFDIEIVYSDLFKTDNEFNRYTKGLYWKYNKDSISGINKCIDKIDGIIFISSFPCGLDSLVNELVFRKINKPYLNLIIDDNSIFGGIETRIESFIDILTQKIN